MRLRILTWNVNSIRVRLDHLARVCAAESPDVVCLQETKVADADFPHDAVGELGFPHVLAHGQKAYNGVAILSRRPFASHAGISAAGQHQPAGSLSGHHARLPERPPAADCSDSGRRQDGLQSPCSRRGAGWC